MLKNRTTSPCCFLTSFLSQSGLKLLKNVCSGFSFSEELSGPWKDSDLQTLSCSGRTRWDYWRHGGAKSSSLLALILTRIQFLAGFSYQFMLSMLFPPAHPWLLIQGLYLSVQVSQASIFVCICRAFSEKAQIWAAIWVKAMFISIPSGSTAADTTSPSLPSSPSQTLWGLGTALLPEQRVSKQLHLGGCL